ncbi:MAG: hypothetical protein R2734_09725 [Nocardioides sp.]
MTSARPSAAATLTTTPFLEGPALTRVGGLPADAVTAQTALVQVALGQLAEARGRLDSASAALVDALFAVVPTIENDAVRRRVLAGKRAAHRGSDLPWRPHELGPAIEGPEAGRYRDALAQVAVAEAGLDAALDDDRRSVLEQLTAAVDDPDFIAALAVAAPDWLRWARPQERPPTSAKDLKTLLLYVT